MQFIKPNEQFCQDLASQGWAIVDDFFDQDLIEALERTCITQKVQGKMQAAGVGRADQIMLQPTLRGDQTWWLEPGLNNAVDRYLEHMETLRQYLNQQLFLGLDSTENHFAYYPEGAFYQAHRDCFQGSNSRVISTVLYLNPAWQPAHGGELRIHDNDQFHDIAPRANRFVMFVSAEILHEVRPTNTTRLSLTGWFRRAEQP